MELEPLIPMKPNQTSKTQGKPCCPEQTQAEMSGGEPNAQELALVTKSFVQCLVQRGYRSKDLIEAAMMLLDGAIDEIQARPQSPETDGAEATQSKAKRSSKLKSGSARGAHEKLVAAPR